MQRHLNGHIGIGLEALAGDVVQHGPELVQAENGRGDDQVDRLADRLGGGPAEETLGGWVPQRDPAGRDVADDDGIAGVDEEWAEPEVTLARAFAFARAAGWVCDRCRAVARKRRPRRCSMRKRWPGCGSSSVR